MDELQITTAKK